MQQLLLSVITLKASKSFFVFIPNSLKTVIEINAQQSLNLSVLRAATLPRTRTNIYRIKKHVSQKSMLSYVASVKLLDCAPLPSLRHSMLRLRLTMNFLP